MFKSILRFVVIPVVAAIGIFSALAFTGTSETNAAAIATFIGVLLPFGLKYIPAAGHYMVAITLGASLLSAVGAEILSGELQLGSLQDASAGTLIVTALSVWGLSQIVYSTLSQHPATAGAVQ